MLCLRGFSALCTSATVYVSLGNEADLRISILDFKYFSSLAIVMMAKWVFMGPVSAASFGGLSYCFFLSQP